tara:strand:+ start:4730 stop:5212 length:483 start_codon:yes stop_codon:yes gene_type:complete
MKTTEEKVKALILDDVKDAFPKEIMQWWISENADDTRDYLFDVEEKFLIDITEISPSEVCSIKLTMPKRIPFRLKQDAGILDDLSLELGKYDLFWEQGLDDIFHKYQEDFEEALELALDPFFEESFKLWEIYDQAKEAHDALDPYFSRRFKAFLKKALPA